jgi:hypothetical protein
MTYKAFSLCLAKKFASSIRIVENSIGINDDLIPASQWHFLLEK